MECTAVRRLVNGDRVGVIARRGILFERGLVMHRRVFVPTLVLSLLLGGTLPCRANGGKAKGWHFVAEVDRLEFTADIDPFLFALTSVGGKYKVIRIKVKNYGSSSVTLSGKDDTVQVEIDGRTIRGVIELARSDAPLWDGLSPAFRRDLVYPRKVDAHEEESVFVYIPNADVTETPRRLELEYAIKAVTAPAVLRAPVAAVKH